MFITGFFVIGVFGIGAGFVNNIIGLIIIRAIQGFGKDVVLFCVGRAFCSRLHARCGADYTFGHLDLDVCIPGWHGTRDRAHVVRPGDVILDWRID